MTIPSSQPGNFMALDVGTVRVGVAIASTIARLPQPYVTLHNDASLWGHLQAIRDSEVIGQIVVGLPRGLDGQETQQTAYCRQFADEAGTQLGLPVALQDEALTSHQASSELETAKKPHAKGAIDALAAVYILEDYLHENV